MQSQCGFQKVVNETKLVPPTLWLDKHQLTLALGIVSDREKEGGQVCGAINFTNSSVTCPRKYFFQFSVLQFPRKEKKCEF